MRKLIFIFPLFFFLGCATYNITLTDCRFDNNSQFQIDGHKDVKAGVDTTPETVGTIIGNAVSAAVLP